MRQNQNTVPAQSGQMLRTLYWNEETAEIDTLVRPIIAWRIIGDYAEPIVPGTNYPASDRGWEILNGIELADGKFFETEEGGVIFKNIEEAMQEARRRIERERSERLHAD